MDKTTEVLRIGNVNLQVLLGDVKELKADALVQPAGTSPLVTSGVEVASWVLGADSDGFILTALKAHLPFKLGEVIITPAGSLKAKYLFNAVVIDWGHQGSPNEILSDKIVIETARKCIDIALALGLESIAFTPWGTRVGVSEASRVTALLVQAIASALQSKSGALKWVYLISHNPEHYRWFIDRTFVFGVMHAQVNQIRSEIDKLDIPQPANQQLHNLLNGLQSNLSTTVNVFLDKSQQVQGGVNITGGELEIKGDLVGRDHIDNSSMPSS